MAAKKKATKKSPKREKKDTLDTVVPYDLSSADEKQKLIDEVLKEINNEHHIKEKLKRAILRDFDYKFRDIAQQAIRKNNKQLLEFSIEFVAKEGPNLLKATLKKQLERARMYLGD